MPPAGFERVMPLSKRPQTHTLDHAATGIGKDKDIYIYNIACCVNIVNHLCCFIIYANHDSATILWFQKHVNFTFYILHRRWLSYLRTRKVGLNGIDIFNYVFFVYESQFPLNRYINNQNRKTWSNGNPQNLGCDVLSHVAELLDLPSSRRQLTET
jgi:hypothetical protein